MTRRKKKGDAGQPRTGTGDQARGRKPKKSELWMVSGEDVSRHRPLRDQPSGWGIGKVIDIITGKERK